MNKRNLLENIKIYIKANDKNTAFNNYYEASGKEFQKIVKGLYGVWSLIFI